MVERNLLLAPPEKVRLMYQAVVDMVGEGFDINTMKVSDITGRAGIGKGTAYEYFSSKEEIITKALAFDVMKKREYLLGIIEGPGSFPEKMGRIFDYAGEKFCENQTFYTLLRIGTGSYEISEPLKKEYEKVQTDISCGRLEELADRVLEQGVREGILKEQNLYLRRMAFGAQLVAFAACLVAKEQGKKMPVAVEQAKQFAYDSLVKSLN